MKQTKSKPLAAGKHLTLEQHEHCVQEARAASAQMSLDDLRLARARLADSLAKSPPEPDATILRVRGEVAHAEIQRREKGISAWERARQKLIRGVSVERYTDISDWAV